MPLSKGKLPLMFALIALAPDFISSIASTKRKSATRKWAILLAPTLPPGFRGPLVPSPPPAGGGAAATPGPMPPASSVSVRLTLSAKALGRLEGRTPHRTHGGVPRQPPFGQFGRRSQATTMRFRPASLAP